jgi:hypothetical protein
MRDQPMDQEALAQLLHRYMQFRAKEEKTDYDLDAEFFASALKNGARYFFGVQVKNDRMVADDENPNAFLKWSAVKRRVRRARPDTQADSWPRWKHPENIPMVAKQIHDYVLFRDKKEIPQNLLEMCLMPGISYACEFGLRFSNNYILSADVWHPAVSSVGAGPWP